MTSFNKNTLVFSRAANPLPPNKSSEVVVFFDGRTLKTIDFAGNVAPLVASGEQTIVHDTAALKAAEQKLTQLINSTQADLQLNIVEALMALEQLKKSQASNDIATQANIFSLEQQLEKALAEQKQLEQSLKKDHSAAIKSLEKDNKAAIVTIEKSVETLTDVAISNSDAIGGLTSNLKTLVGNFTSSINIKVSKQELHDALKLVKDAIPPEVEVEAGEVTIGKKDEITVTKTGNTYTIDLELKKRKDGTASGYTGITEDAVKLLIEQFAPKTLITSTGGTITVTPIDKGYNIEVANMPPVIVPLAIISFSGGSTNELGSVVNSVNLNWSYNYEPDVSQSLNQGIGTVPLSAHSYSYSSPISGNTTFTLSATDSVHGSTSANVSVQFINRRYFGLFADEDTLESNDIVSLSSELNETRSKSFVSYPCSGNRFVFAYPSRLGVATVRDGNGFIMQDWYTGTSPYTVNVTNAFGYTEEYIVYQTYNRYNGSPTLVFS